MEQRKERMRMEKEKEGEELCVLNEMLAVDRSHVSCQL